jgi:hypothetical protein
MDGLIDLSWRIYPASLLMLSGAAIAMRGVRTEVQGHLMPVREPDKVLTIFRGFRMIMIGVAFAGIGAAWAWHIGWLAILAIVIGAEETFESTLVVFGLTRGPELRLRP